MEQIDLASLPVRRKGLGALAFWVKYGNENRRKELLRELLTPYMAIKRGPIPKRVLHEIAEVAMGYWLNDGCKKCNAKGCDVCHGTGRKAKPNVGDTHIEMDNEQFRKEIIDALNLLEEAAGEYIKKLNRKKQGAEAPSD